MQVDAEVPQESLPVRLACEVVLVVGECRPAIPEGCGITVAGGTRTWQEGKCLLFDYSFEHAVWNRGTRRPLFRNGRRSSP
ncbi:aspartyl/asparaginyl beta-hydroxylase domain-containing protein [Streptomyces sp. NPDC059629]|uniref:aspartyl/asparaginyl beta-hydroxylase domain-containing protein n=1 Tax=Streptomyces sp. NPDC059629 TaxID=3346889 RepID=UPI0036943CEC